MQLGRFRFGDSRTTQGLLKSKWSTVVDRQNPSIANHVKRGLIPPSVAARIAFGPDFILSCKEFKRSEGSRQSLNLPPNCVPTHGVQNCSKNGVRLSTTFPIKEKPGLYPIQHCWNFWCDLLRAEEKDRFEKLYL